jgi:hypothetical protein
MRGGMRLIVFLALIMLGPACAAPLPQSAPDYWIFSWVMRSGVYRYVIVRESERSAFVNGFQPSFPGNGDISQVEAHLRRLPPGAHVGWGNATCLGLTYPPKDIVRSLRLFAARNKINLVVLPGQCEQ